MNRRDRRPPADRRRFPAVAAAGSTTHDSTGKLRDAAGNVRNARLVLAAAASSGLYFAHAVGLESLGYTGVVRETELLVWLSVAAFGVVCYCWYRGSRVDRGTD